jgi:hypothetical protein
LFRFSASSTPAWHCFSSMTIGFFGHDVEPAESRARMMYWLVERSLVLFTMTTSGSGLVEPSRRIP